MIRSSHSKDPNAIEAMFSTELPGTVDVAQLPNDLQWMPPGEHTINASRGGKPVELTVKVDASTAATVQGALASILASAQTGQGDSPFIDFNHDDQEAAGWAKSFRWAGEDPQRGGVRLDLEWSGAGKQAVLGRNYHRFSPSFYLDAAGNVSGIPVNLGGLVNRAAFQRIAPVMSKQATAEALTSTGDFLTKAKAVMRARNLDLVDAATLIAKNDPYLYECYCWELYRGGGSPPKPREETPYLARARLAYNDAFCIQARELSDALEISEADAAEKLARSQPALYERYRAKLGLGDQRSYQERVTSVHARAESTGFFVLAKQIATERSIEMLAAYDIAARQRPDLYDQYRASL